MARLVDRILRRWQRTRPLPRPVYVRGAPSTADRFPPGVYQVPNIQTVAAAACSAEARDFVVDLLGRLAPSGEIEGQEAYYQICRAQFGQYWSFADLTTALWAAARLISPENYLEIGVRRGRSAAVVARVRPECAIYGFDLWIEGYADVENPGPAFVREELGRIGHRGTLELVSGDSKATVPSFLGQHPDLYFDLINVDGDHSLLGAATDLANVLPRLKIGGIVVFDDLNSAPDLRRVWKDLVKDDSRFFTWEFTDAGYGVAAAVRVSDAPLLKVLNR